MSATKQTLADLKNSLGLDRPAGPSRPLSEAHDGPKIARTMTRGLQDITIKLSGFMGDVRGQLRDPRSGSEEELWGEVKIRLVQAKDLIDQAAGILGSSY